VNISNITIYNLHVIYYYKSKSTSLTGTNLNCGKWSGQFTYWLLWATNYCSFNAVGF